MPELIVLDEGHGRQMIHEGVELLLTLAEMLFHALALDGYGVEIGQPLDLRQIALVVVAVRVDQGHLPHQYPIGHRGRGDKTLDRYMARRRAGRTRIIDGRVGQQRLAMIQHPAPQPLELLEDNGLVLVLADIPNVPAER